MGPSGPHTEMVRYPPILLPDQCPNLGKGSHRPHNAHAPDSHLRQHQGLRHSSRSTHSSPLPRPAGHSPLPCPLSTLPLQPEKTLDHSHLASSVTCSESHLLPHRLFPCSPCYSHAGLVSLPPASQVWSCLMALVQAEPLPGMLSLPFSLSPPGTSSKVTSTWHNEGPARAQHMPVKSRVDTG